MELERKDALKLQLNADEKRLRYFWLVSTLLYVFISLWTVKFFWGDRYFLGNLLLFIFYFAVSYHFAFRKFGNNFLRFFLVKNSIWLVECYINIWVYNWNQFRKNSVYILIVLTWSLTYVWWFERSNKLMRLNQWIRFKMTAEGEFIERRMRQISNEQELISVYKELIASKPQHKLIITAIYKDCRHFLVAKKK